MTKRLHLRLPDATDFPAYAALLSELEVNRFIGGNELAEPAAAISRPWLAARPLAAASLCAGAAVVRALDPKRLVSVTGRVQPADRSKQ